MAQQGELLMGKQGHHIRPWGYQSAKKHGVQGLAEGQNQLTFQHHVCGPLEEHAHFDLELCSVILKKCIFYLYYLICFTLKTAFTYLSFCLDLPCDRWF